MWASFLFFGGFWFWALCAVELIFLVYAIEEELMGPSFISVFVLCMLLWLFGDISVIGYIIDNPVNALRYAVAYAVCGFVWSIVKFYFKTSKLRRKINGLKAKFIKDNPDKEPVVIEPSGKTLVDSRGNGVASREEAWKRHLSNALSHEEIRQLQFGHHSKLILFWMTYWPISLVWTLLDDPIKRLFTWAYNTFLIGIYRKIHAVTIGNATKL